MATQSDVRRRKRKGFVQTGGLLAAQIRTIGGARGFAETRLLTHWADIAGPELAAIARPGKVSYRREGMGASLTLECSGAHGPELQMQLPALRQRINAAYGYAAIADIRLSQTAVMQGFAEGAAAFTYDAPPSPKLNDTPPAPVQKLVADVGDDGLRAQLALLGANVLNKKRTKL